MNKQKRTTPDASFIARQTSANSSGAVFTSAKSDSKSNVFRNQTIPAKDRTKIKKSLLKDAKKG
ncbi:MAG: hypothetical protein OXI88_12515 [Gammaproteobacteria bacterium]|nr:hypothetical protein [Gammaproteobacteria bacterium]MDE0286134.1 hypothetical protein [Gammaproteobacteria bacterium]MDE0512598.1 hypothetical protein [Gammaproteobacteria bacterium]